VGFGHSWTNAETATGTSKKFNPSFNAGLRLVYSASPNLGIGLDGIFHQEGQKTEFTGGKSTVHLNYINLDPKLYYFFGKYGQSFRPKIGIGPDFGFLVGGKQTTTIGTTESEIKAKDVFKGFNFGASGLVGFNYRIKSGTWLNVDAVYKNGFSDLTKDNGSDIKSRSIFLNIGVTFGIGHVEKK
jgi:outer membrane protein W